MHTVTATEASRSFAALLDEVANGERVIITRGGKRIAEIGPAPVGNGKALVDFIRSVEVDVDYIADVEAARGEAILEGPAWPAD